MEVGELEFACWACAKEQPHMPCRIRITMILQGGVPKFVPDRCVLSSSMDKDCKWIYIK